MRNGRRQVLSSDQRLFDFTVSTAFLPPLAPGLPSPLVTASDQEYRSALLNARADDATSSGPRSRSPGLPQ